MVMMLVSPAVANFIQTPTATVSCTGYSISLQACSLVTGDNYTIDYNIVISPSSALPASSAICLISLRRQPPMVPRLVPTTLSARP
jgi:hypothetical protein